MVHIRQAGGLLRGSQGLKLAEVCKVGLLRNLLGGGGGGERSSAPGNALGLDTMPCERYGRLRADQHRSQHGQLFLFVCFFSFGGVTCVGSGRGGTAGGKAVAEVWGCPAADVAAKLRFMSRDDEREWEGWGRGGGGGGATTFRASGDAPD